ncbi:MAG: 30S ribosomal protein S6 [Elusimicrobiota bacterium]
MSIYETVVVIDPKLSDPEVATLAEKTKQTIVKAGGEVLNEDHWGRRKLAYPIRHLREGYYLYIKFQAKGALIGQLNQQFRLQETILRSLTVHAEEPKHNGKKAPKKT